jgi:transcriptional regulator with XRE-family HTH domain
MVINIQKLKELRKSKRFTQTELSNKANIAQNYYSSIETGKSTPALDTAVAMAYALGVTVNDLLIDPGVPNPPQPPTPEAPEQAPESGEKTEPKSAA